jgi:hypothetical protein
MILIATRAFYGELEQRHFQAGTHFEAVGPRARRLVKLGYARPAPKAPKQARKGS